MNEIVDLINEYEAIQNKESLYARVLMSFIADREVRTRHTLDRQIEVTTRDGGQLVRLKHLAQTATIEHLRFV
ncbi:hypothetical protein E2553_42455 [Paraburkholderia dipogonis]|uniref:Uncharacterized protein n=1 Tax=Paraburkholderia dipogonis TaxID=1211383 RepID=A0A4Y8MG41_9BURK|nr:hypothetical protein [Paraburkholderia dipogonis]TFE36426.1 hypothetical protein E2553_42455 [Paraburkholderia dipogonis]